MADVILFHNSACSTSRRALDEIEAGDYRIEVVQYLKTPPERDALLDLIGMLQDPVTDLVRKDDFFEQQGLIAEDFVTLEAVADLLIAHPRAGKLRQVDRYAEVTRRPFLACTELQE